MCIRDRFLFVVMMLDQNVDPVREGFIKYLPVGASVALLIMIEMGLVVSSGYFGTDQYNLVAVSYTHLDVYKRQPYCWAWRI